jgi:hypothetical protein
MYAPLPRILQDKYMLDLEQRPIPITQKKEEQTSGRPMHPLQINESLTSNTSHPMYCGLWFEYNGQYLIVWFYTCRRYCECRAKVRAW